MPVSIALPVIRKDGENLAGVPPTRRGGDLACRHACSTATGRPVWPPFELPGVPAMRHEGPPAPLQVCVLAGDTAIRHSGMSAGRQGSPPAGVPAVRPLGREECNIAFRHLP